LTGPDLFALGMKNAKQQALWPAAIHLLSMNFLKKFPPKIYQSITIAIEYLV
jgi:hypothetical protein